MSFPYLHDSNLELGNTSEWDSEVDTESKLSIKHYTELVRRYASIAAVGYKDCLPYTGAYCAHIDLSLGTADAYLEETGNFDTALGGTIHTRFYFWANGLVMAASDRFTIFALQSGAGTDEATISVYNNAGRLQLVAAETGATAVGAGTRACDLLQGQWHCLELASVIDSGAANGTITFRVDGFPIGAAMTGLTQAAITQARLGAIGIDAGTTAGHLLFDNIVADDTRVGQWSRRYGRQRILTKSGHAAIGPGTVIEAYYIQAEADNTMILHDTDVADLTDMSRQVHVYDAFRPYEFTKGLYVELGGTNPRGVVMVWDALDLSSEGVRRLALR